MFLRPFGSKRLRESYVFKMLLCLSRKGKKNTKDKQDFHLWVKTWGKS